MKLLSFVFSAIFLNSTCWSYQVISELKKKINDGEILGRYMTSTSGRTISAFIGIPFASPPVGNLRFKAPQKVVPWKGTLTAQEQQSKCPQFGQAGVVGDEDCLYLNVYVPETDTDTKLDVIVWFYGGGFRSGHAGPSSFAPDHLLDHDVIFVAGNYRLGALGFLSTEDRNSPGNFGLKDQAFLLQWVQDNIEHFGGNKNSVTIWGESAGGVSVNYHMVSKMSEGLFHRAIASSGGLPGPSREGSGKLRTLDLAKKVNCPILNDASAIIKCLRLKSPEEIILSGVKFSTVVESFESDEPAFIEQRNYNNRFSNYAEIPLMIGMNSEEGLLTLGAYLDNDAALDTLLKTWDEYIPGHFLYGHLNITVRQEITGKINAFYFGSEATPTSPLDKQKLMDLFTDVFIEFTATVQKRLEENSHRSTYMYLFTHKGHASYSASKNYHGTSHVDDLIPMFPLYKALFHGAVPTSQDRELTKVMTLMWTNFARFGNPTPIGSEVPIWPSVTSGSFASMQYMQIGNENGRLENEVLQVKEGYQPSRSEFWKKLQEDYSLNPWFEDDPYALVRNYWQNLYYTINKYSNM